MFINFVNLDLVFFLFVVFIDKEEEVEQLDRNEEGEEEEGLSAQKLKHQLEEFKELLGRGERDQEDLDSLQLHIQKEEGEEEAARGY